MVIRSSYKPRGFHKPRICTVVSVSILVPAPGSRRRMSTSLARSNFSSWRYFVRKVSWIADHSIVKVHCAFGSVFAFALKHIHIIIKSSYLISPTCVPFSTDSAPHVSHFPFSTLFCVKASFSYIKNRPKEHPVSESVRSVRYAVFLQNFA